MDLLNDIVVNIRDKKLFNISYREYVLLYEDKIIFIYPFTIEIFNKIDFNLDDFYYEKTFKLIEHIRFHNIDYIDDKCNYSAMKLYEELTGDYIHTNKLPSIQPSQFTNLYYETQKEEFLLHLRISERKNKINKIKQKLNEKYHN